MELMDELVELSSDIVEWGANDAYTAAFEWVDRLTLIDDYHLIRAFVDQLANNLVAEPPSDADL
jgi:hypothetical protein